MVWVTANALRKLTSMIPPTASGAEAVGGPSAASTMALRSFWLGLSIPSPWGRLASEAGAAIANACFRRSLLLPLLRW